MARIIDETFEGSNNGYDEAWTETVDSGQTVNQDSSGPGTFPSGGGTECLQIIKTATSDARAFTTRDYGSQQSVSYTRAYVYYTARSLASGNAFYIFSVGNAANPLSVGASAQCSLYNNAGTYVWRMGYHIAAGWQYIVGTDAVQLDTWYRVELEINNGTISFRVNGTQIGSTASGVTLDRGTPRYWHVGVYYGGTNTTTFYEDLFAVDNATWVGEEITDP
ncbi:MAG: hypothetical protein V2A73_21290, partial [Pseudomonadota bacterium]